MISKSECAECAKESVLYDLYFVFFQTVFKSLIALMTGSISLGASSLLSLGDFFSKIINWASIKVSKLHPSDRFPYGYGKIQFLTSIIIGFILILSAIILLHNNLEVLDEANTKAPSLLALLAIIITALASEIMYRYLNCVSVRNNLSNIKAAALDNRMDVFSSIIVMLGILLSYLGWEDADFWSAVIISFFVFYLGIKIIFDAMKNLLDISLDEKIMEEITLLVLRTKDVVQIDYCRGRSLGERWELNLQIAINDELTSTQIESLIMKLKKAILSIYPEFSFLQISHSLASLDSNELDKEIIDAFKKGS